MNQQKKREIQHWIFFKNKLQFTLKLLVNSTVNYKEMANNIELNMKYLSTVEWLK